MVRMTGALFVSLAATLLLGSDCHEVRNRIGEDKIILVTTQSAIYKSKGIHPTFNQLTISGVVRPYAIDVDVDRGLIFWTDLSHQIKRASLNGSDVTLVTGTRGEPRGIAIDPNEEEIYWIDASYGYIEMVKYDGSGKRRVVQVGGGAYIAVHTERRELYWTDSTQGVRKCSCNGCTPQTLVRPSLSYLRGIALNTNGSRIYWCNRNKIESSDIYGSIRRTVLSLSSSGMSGQCYGIAWFEEEIYLAGDSTNSLGVVNERTGQYRTFNRGGLVYPRDIFVGRLPPQVPDYSGGKCDFERIRCSWQWSQSKTDDLDWVRRVGETPANTSAPNVDHSTQKRSGYFMFIDTTHQSDGDVATLTSPPINVSMTTPKCFRFWYYMHHVTSGSLMVIFQPETKTTSTQVIWTAFGEQPDEWIGAEVQMPDPGVGNILIQAIVGDPSSNSVAIDDVQYGDCRHASSLTCDETSMTVYLDRARLGISTHDDITLRSSLCRGYEYDPDTFAIKTSYNECGTTIQEKHDSIEFTNEVTVSARSGIRNSDIQIRVNCSLSRNYRVEMNYLAHKWIKYIKDDAYGNFSVGIQQYPTEKFHLPYPSSSYPLQVNEGDFIYVATEMSAIKDMVELKNTRCWATKLPNPSDDVEQELILDGCPVGGSIKVFSSVNYQRLRPFSFKAFSFSQDMDMIYVHCDVIICHQSFESLCHDDCSGSRSTRETHFRGGLGLRSGPHTVSQGPFIFKSSTSKARDGVFNVNSFLLIAACACMLILMAAVLYARRRV